MLFNTNENSFPQQVVINKEDIKTLDTRVAYLEALDGVLDPVSIVDVIQVDESNYDNLPTAKTSFYGITYYQNQILLAYTYGDLTFYGRTVKIERTLNDNVLYQKAHMINSADSTDRLYIYRVYSYETLSWSEWCREPSRDEITNIKVNIAENTSEIDDLFSEVGLLKDVVDLTSELTIPAFLTNVEFKKSGNVFNLRGYCTKGSILGTQYGGFISTKYIPTGMTTGILSTDSVARQYGVFGVRTNGTMYVYVTTTTDSYLSFNITWVKEV